MSDVMVYVDETKYGEHLIVVLPDGTKRSSPTTSYWSDEDIEFTRLLNRNATKNTILFPSDIENIRISMLKKLND